MDKHSSLLCRDFSDGEITFYNIDSIKCFHLKATSITIAFFAFIINEVLIRRKETA